MKTTIPAALAAILASPAFAHSVAAPHAHDGSDGTLAVAAAVTAFAALAMLTAGRRFVRVR
jgi:hypothetical protein